MFSKIRTPGGQSTQLTKRATPKQKIDGYQTTIYRTYNIPRQSLLKRMNNNRGLFGNQVPQFSYLQNDIVYSWKNPVFYDHLKIPKSSNFKTINEATEYPDNNSYVYSCFNGININDLIISCDDKDPGVKNDVFTFNNSFELMNAIDIIGIILNDSFMLEADDFENVEDKRTTVKVTERGLKSIFNIAHKGIDLGGKAIIGGFHDLPESCYVEAFFPYFQQEHKNKKTNLLIKTDVENNDDTTTIGSKTYEYIINPDWVKEYKKCQVQQYRGDNRFGLLYRRYDPKGEAMLNKKLIVDLRIFNVLMKLDIMKNNDSYEDIYKKIKNILNLKDDMLKKKEIIVLVDRLRNNFLLLKKENNFVNNIVDSEYKILIEEYNEKKHMLRKNIIGIMKKTCKKNASNGYIFYNFNR